MPDDKLLRLLQRCLPLILLTVGCVPHAPLATPTPNILPTRNPSSVTPTAPETLLPVGTAAPGVVLVTGGREQTGASGSSALSCGAYLGAFDQGGTQYLCAPYTKEDPRPPSPACQDSMAVDAGCFLGVTLFSFDLQAEPLPVSAANPLVFRADLESREWSVRLYPADSITDPAVTKPFGDRLFSTNIYPDKLILTQVLEPGLEAAFTPPALPAGRYILILLTWMPGLPYPFEELVYIFHIQISKP